MNAVETVAESVHAGAPFPRFLPAKAQAPTKVSIAKGLTTRCIKAAMPWGLASPALIRLHYELPTLDMVI